jgi:hypothetical protein
MRSLAGFLHKALGSGPSGGVRQARHLRGWLCLAVWVITVWGADSLLAQPLPPPTVADTLAPVSQELVRHCLARSISVQGLASPAATNTQRYGLMRWASSAGASLAGRLGGWWYTPESDAAAQTILDTLRRNIQVLHAQSRDVAAQGCLFEIIWPHVNNLTVPNRLRADFGEDTLATPSRHFKFAEMMYPGYFSAADSNHYRWDVRPPGQAPGTPDLSRPEAQLWFYYCAARQIDAGCEALHFGQIQLMDDRDPGHRAMWHLLQRIRRYAHTRNRGFVLCDAHTHGEFYDPHPAYPLPDSVRQLLFDFHSYPLRPNEADTVRHGTHSAHLDLDSWGNPAGAIFRLSKGGRAPGGWLCRHLPAQAEFDNGPTGTIDKPGQWPLVWGRDEISWFANQPTTYRSKWLIYAQGRVRQLDPDAYLQMPGVRGVVLPAYPHELYWATDAGQSETIRAIWAGETTTEAAQLLLIGPPTPTHGQ